MAKYNGSGWHKQSIRHSKARKYGRAGGKYAGYSEQKGYLKGRHREFLKENPKFTRLDMMYKWEDINQDYTEYQMAGLIQEIQNEYQDEGYIDEKLRNIKNNFNTTFDNFARRIKNKELRKEFIARLKKEEKNNNLLFAVERKK